MFIIFFYAPENIKDTPIFNKKLPKLLFGYAISNIYILVWFFDDYIGLNYLIPKMFLLICITTEQSLIIHLLKINVDVYK